MDLKPIVTNFGEEALYQDLSKDIERRLPSQPVNWKRTYGRESKTVNIKATFTKFNSDQLGVTTDGTVTKQPFLHLYWTSCLENDEFRNGVKQRISNWLDNLRSRNISDWLIIQVVYPEKNVYTRNRISLPRSSVFDRIKNELCGKNSARVVQFWDPKKETLYTKSRDSWVSLLSHLRQLLLDSISKHLTKFEEKVRHHREKYAQPNWSFLEYLKLNEELATIFRSVTLHNDALVQYDELDALFSQFVVNAQINGIPAWMKQFTITPKCWDGISLNKNAVKHFRDAVYNGQASLIDLRNYIFIRQWQMLVNVHKSWDVAQRLLDFLFAVVNEMKLLLTDLSCCVPACWVVSCCLEYMHTVENKEFANRNVMASLALIFDYARDKLYLLGQECKLLPGQVPAEDFIKGVVFGLCKSQPIKEGNEIGTRSLLNALSSQAKFDKLYLRTCGRTKSLFSSIGRFRFANRVGIDMAKYYMMKRKYGSAETQLLPALSDFNQSKWNSLYIDVLEPLAKCQEEVESFDNYLRSLAALACTKTLSVEKRLFYSEKFLESARNENEKTYTVSTDPVISLDDVKIDLIKEIGHVGESINVVLVLGNNLLKELTLDEIEIRMRFTETDKVRLSSADGGISSQQRPNDRTSWSELFQEQSEPLSPSVTKSGILQRIKSRRVVKQKDPSNRDDASNDTSMSPGSELGGNDVFIDEFNSSDLQFTSDKPKTLADMAKELPRTLSTSEEYEERATEKSSKATTDIAHGVSGNLSPSNESAGGKSENSLKTLLDIAKGVPRSLSFTSESVRVKSEKSLKILKDVAKGVPRSLSFGGESTRVKSGNFSEPVAIPNGRIESRCESSASSLSVVSISSNAGASSLNEHSNLSPELKGSREEPCITPLALNEASNLNIHSAENEACSDDVDHSLSSHGEELSCGENRGSHERRAGSNAEDECSDNEFEVQEEDDFEELSADGEDGGKGQRAKFSLDSEKFDDDDDVDDEDSANNGSAEVKRQQNKDTDAPLNDESDECFQIEEEVEVLPTKSLLSGPIVLYPGKNTVNVNAKVLHIGRYTLQTLLCRIGKIFLYNLLGLPRQSRAFFVVSDPPKFSWTSTHIADCLLLGNKQRIHVTLSNGPGVIHESSVIQLSSSTGLEFSPVPPSSVMVYSTNKREEPREGAMHIEMNGENTNQAYMYLPKCGPYEKADLYFDAKAPVETAGLLDHMTKHEVSLKCLWLADLVPSETILESFYYEPFAIEYENMFCTNGNFLRTALISLNPVQINIIKPELICLNSDKFSFSCLSCDVQMTVSASEELSLIWKVEDCDQEKDCPQILVCRLKVNFKTEDVDEAGEFSKQFEVTNITQQRLKVETSIRAEKDSPVYKGSSYDFHVSIKSVNNGLPKSYLNGQITCCLVDDDQWQYDDDTKNRKQLIETTDGGSIFEFTTKVIPCTSGLLRHPTLAFSRMLQPHENEVSHGRLPHASAALTTNRLSSSRRTSAGANKEFPQPFAAGEVAYTSAGRYIKVLQPKRQVSVL